MQKDTWSLERQPSTCFLTLSLPKFFPSHGLICAKKGLFSSVRSYLHLSGHLSGSLPASHLSEEGLRLAPGVHQGRVEAFEAGCREAELDHLSWHGAHAGTPTKLEIKELDCLFSSLIGSSLEGIRNECFSFESADWLSLSLVGSLSSQHSEWAASIKSDLRNELQSYAVLVSIYV